MAIVNLTSSYVESLKRKPPSSGRIEVWDEKTPGLCLRISSTGAASWSFRYRPRDGAGYQRITLGTLASLGLADARTRAARHRVEVHDGADPQGERKIKRAAAVNVLTFDKLAERYLAEYAKPRKASWRMDELYLKRPRAAWRDSAATAITRRDVITLLDNIKLTAPVSANRTHSILTTLFNWAVEDELLDANPVSGLKKRAVEKAKDRALSDDELRVLWQALSEPLAVSADIADALRVILLTGQRPGEVAGTTRRELVALGKPAETRWELPAERTKVRRPHIVPVGRMAAQLLYSALQRREGEECETVFASRFTSRATLARHSLSQGLARVVQRLNAEGPDAEAVRTLKDKPPTPHDFRRTVATGMAALGIPREDRLAVLGHLASDVHGMHYDRYERLREKRIALEAWERHVAQVLGEEPASIVVPIQRTR